MKNIIKNSGLLIALFFMSQNIWAQKSEITVDAYSVKMAIECDEVAEKAKDITATSTCGGEVTITKSDADFSGGCVGTIARTWTLTDACGTTKTVEQYITLLDNKAPVLTPVEDVVVTDINQVVIPTVTDNCMSDVKVTYADQRQNDNGTVVIMRTYKAVDNCSNAASLRQKITVTAAD